MKTEPIGIKINNQLYLTKKEEKSWREKPFVGMFFFLSVVLMYYFVFVGYINAFDIDLNKIVGFGNYYVNFFVALLIFCFGIYLLYCVLFRLLTLLAVGINFNVLFDHLRIKRYFFFWYAVRNIAIALLYLLTLFLPYLSNYIFVIKMLLTLTMFMFLFFDLMKYVFGEIFGTFTFGRLSKFVITYYAISTIVNYWSYCL